MIDSRYATVTEIVEAVRSGRCGPEAFVERALDDVAQTEAALKAWVEIDSGAAQASRGVDPSKPLAGVPFGVKDVIDVRGLRTRQGVDPRATSFIERWLQRCRYAVGRAPTPPSGRVWL